MKTITTHYEVLGIHPSSDTEAMRVAYHDLARRYHPDVSTDPLAHERMARINEAFATLIDEETRTQYDTALRDGVFADRHREESDAKRANRKPIVVRLRARLKGHNTPIYASTFDPENGQFISSAFDNELLWWDIKKGEVVRRMKIEAGVVSTLQPAGPILVASGASESTVAYWRVKNGKVESWRSVNDEWVNSVAIAPNGGSIATGSLHKVITTWSCEDAHQIYQRQDFSDAVTAICYSADGELIAAGTADSIIKIYHAPTGAPLQTIRGARSMISAIAFSPDRRYVAVGSVDLSIRVFAMEDGALVKMMFGHVKPIEALAFHPNSWLLASASRDGTVGLWNAAEGVGNVRIECSTRPISTVSFSHDGKILAAGGQDKLIRLWDVASKRRSDHS